MDKNNKSTEVDNTDKKLHISDVISSLSDNTPSFDDDFIEKLKETDKKFSLDEMFIAYRTASVNGHFRGAGREKYEFLDYIKQNYL